MWWGRNYNFGRGIAICSEGTWWSATLHGSACVPFGPGQQHFDPSHYANSIKMSPHPYQLLESIRTIITVQYGETFSRMLTTTTTTREAWSPLVSASLFQWKVTRDDKFGLKTVGELESQGIIFVELSTAAAANVTAAAAKPKEYAIVFSLLLLTNLLQQNSWPMLLQNFNVKLSSDENEQNTLAILSLKCKGLRVMGRPITVDALLPNYAPDLDWRLEPLSFDDNFEMIYSESWVTVTTWEAFLSEFKGKSVFILNGRSAPFCNMVIVSKDGKRVILIQGKQIKTAKESVTKKRKVPSFGHGAVKEAHEKCNVGTSHLFVMLSDMDFTGEKELEANEIVLHRKEHECPIEPLLALLRRHNHGHRPKFRLKNRK